MNICEVPLVPLVLQISSANIPDAERRGTDYSTPLRRKLPEVLMVKTRCVSRASLER